MALARRERDERPRVRCPECGKRLKLPAGKPGKIFRCPVCGGSVIAPLDADVVNVSPQDLSAQALRQMGWAPSFVRRKRYKSIERVANFISKEYADLAQSCATLLAEKPLEEREAAGHILRMRREKGRRLVDFARRTFAEVNRDIRELERHPLRRQQDLAERLEALRRERRDLAIFMKVMFNVDLPGVHLTALEGRRPAAPSAPAPDRPGGDAGPAPGDAPPR